MCNNTNANNNKRRLPIAKQTHFLSLGLNLLVDVFTSIQYQLSITLSFLRLFFFFFLFRLLFFPSIFFLHLFQHYFFHYQLFLLCNHIKILLCNLSIISIMQLFHHSFIFNHSYFSSFLPPLHFFPSVYPVHSFSHYYFFRSICYLFLLTIMFFFYYSFIFITHSYLIIHFHFSPFLLPIQFLFRPFILSIHSFIINFSICLLLISFNYHIFFHYSFVPITPAPYIFFPPFTIHRFKVFISYQ